MVMAVSVGSSVGKLTGGGLVQRRSLRMLLPDGNNEILLQVIREGTGGGVPGSVLVQVLGVGES